MHAPGLNFVRPSVTADGSTLVFRVNRHVGEAYVAEFDAERVQFGELTRALRSSDRSWLVDWAPEGDAVLLQFERKGMVMYRQSLDKSEPEPLFPGADSRVELAVFSPVGEWILYPWMGRPAMLMRVRPGGGSRKRYWTWPRMTHGSGAGDDQQRIVSSENWSIENFV
jgi:hypothetical protein